MNILYVITFTALSFVSSTSMHTHRSSGQKEREEDGAFTQRDSMHYDKDGSHHTQFDHEAILGSRTMADEFDSLPPEVSKSKLKEISLKMDKDKDGIITRDELRDWVLKSFSLLSKEEADEKFDEEDENQDGKVTWAEHVNDVFGSFIDDNEISTDNLEQEKLKDEDKLLFEIADSNNDGVLDSKEFVAFTNPEEHKHMYPALYKRTMEEKDKNNDGFISQDEFIGEFGHKNEEQYLIEKDRFEKEFDLNHDNKLDEEEVLKWLIPDNNEIANDEVEHLIHEADKDHDGRLSIEEIVDNHDVFVGSEVTDFGAHLHDTDKFTHEEL
ncbi:Reticulocalbin-2 [Nymphon striatum]|nr:Reticulocalbin-2 [Nymphon striatum]